VYNDLINSINTQGDKKMENLNKSELVIWCKAKLDVLESELKRIADGIAPDYVQDIDLLGNNLMRSEMIKDEIKDLKITINSNI